jgi:signal transduction histidine kinase
VEIRADRSDGRVRIAVDDAGPGIADEERERVFERFQRIGRSEDDPGGVGLTLARAVARLLGGDVEIELSPLGGARFVFWLPVAPPARPSLAGERA